MKLRLFSLAAAAVLLAAAVSSVNTPASAASTVVVTPSNQQGWTTAPPVADNRPGGTVGFVLDASAPGGTGALQMTTDTGAAKAQYMHTTNTPLADVTTLGYYTKQVSASFAQGDPSYQLAVCLGGVNPSTGACIGFTTLVYEPYWNGGVTAGIWQSWNVAAGQFWSSRSYSDSGCTVVAGAGGPPLYSLNDIKTMCPNAVVGAFGVNVGSGNPGYNVETDLFNFNGTIYDFEVYSAPSDKDQCKNGGWATFNPNRAAGPFKNQGDCIQYFNNGK